VHRAALDVLVALLGAGHLHPVRAAGEPPVHHGVGDFGMKLQPVKLALRILHRGEVRTLGLAGGAKTLRQRGNFIAMTVPDVELRAESVEQLRTVCHFEHARSELAAAAEFHLTAEMMRHLHEAVANAEDGNAERENFRVNLRCVFFVNAGRAAGENDSFRLEILDLRRRNVERDNLRVDLQFPNPPRDDLRVLRTEIEDKNFGMGGRRGWLHGHG